MMYDCLITIRGRDGRNRPLYIAGEDPVAYLIARATVTALREYGLAVDTEFYNGDERVVEGSLDKRASNEWVGQILTDLEGELT